MTAQGYISPEQFVEKWRDRNLSERSSSQSHFIELCRMLDVAAPYDNRADDENYCFDAVTATAGSGAYEAAKRAGKSRERKHKRERHQAALFGDGGAGDTDVAGPTSVARDGATRIVPAKKGHGFADVWKREHFCWEYKRQGQADLDAALAQLKQYRDSLDNPPLLVVCDIDTFEIHTNFTDYPTESYRFGLNDLADTPQEWRARGISPLQLLRKAFTEPQWFKPKKTVYAITEDFAERVAGLAERIWNRNDPDTGKKHDPHEVAHFLMQVMFSLFAEDIGLLPADRVTNLLRRGNNDPDEFKRKAKSLFLAMEKGGDFGEDTISWFNGGLFKDVAKQRIPKLLGGEIGVFITGGETDWSAVEPSILGTLFERALNPEKRAQIGAHYTSRDDIMLIIDPVIMEPLRGEWAKAQEAVGRLIAKREKTKDAASKKAAQGEIAETVKAFHKRLCDVTVLDPACGSGNFLYVAIQCLLDLEKQVLMFAARPEVSVSLKAKVSPTQLRGIEINDYAAELARISIWIGYLKWKRENGLLEAQRPILHPLDTIECRDAILDLRNPKKPMPAKWPHADFIVGNPPFLGTKLLRRGLTDAYVETLFDVYKDRIPGFSDLVCYWFELARECLANDRHLRVGLLATQAIRNGKARRVLERIKSEGDIFMAWADRKWLLDGAAVHVSIIGFDSGSQEAHWLDGARVTEIHADLTTGVDLTRVRPLRENKAIGFVADVKSGQFDVDWTIACAWLGQPSPNGKSYADVLLPWFNGNDVTARSQGAWIVDFGNDMPESEAAGYEAPFEYVRRVVKPERDKVKRDKYRHKWWIHAEPCQNMREAVWARSRFVATPVTTKHRVFAWVQGRTLPDHAVAVFAREDDYFFGVIHSIVHELWARETGTQLREAASGFRYTPSSCFETFPLPWSPGGEPIAPKRPMHGAWKSIGEAAEGLHGIRENWTNPPKWVNPVQAKVDLKYRAEFAAVPKAVRELVKMSALMAEARKDSKLEGLTLTNLYNQRPAWLRLAHRKLDEAVIAAYAAVDPKGKWDTAWAAVYEPFGAGEIVVRDEAWKKVGGKGKLDTAEVAEAKRAASAARGPVDQKILANLLRLNQERAKAEKGGKSGRRAPTAQT